MVVAVRLVQTIGSSDTAAERGERVFVGSIIIIIANPYITPLMPDLV